MNIKPIRAVVLATACLGAVTQAHGHGASIRVRESQDVVMIVVAAGCAASVAEELSRQPLEGDADGVQVVHTSRFAVCVQRVDAEKGVIEVRDAHGEAFTVSVADAQPPLDRIVVGDTITVTVRRAVALRRSPATPVEDTLPQF